MFNQAMVKSSWQQLKADELVWAEKPNNIGLIRCLGDPPRIAPKQLYK